MDKKSDQRIKALFLTGFFCQEHGNGRRVNELLRSILTKSGKFEVKICEEPRGLTDETLKDYDVILVNYEGRFRLTDPGRRFGEQTEQALYRFVSGGKGMVFYHGSVWVDDAWPEEYKKLMGGYYKMRHGRRNPNGDFVIQREEEHTGITRYMPPQWMTVEDDMFAGVTWVPGCETEVLCSAYDDVKCYEVPGFPPAHHPVDIPNGDLNQMPDINKNNPMAWINRYGKGRTVTIPIGHGEGTIMRAGFLTLFVRSMEWAATGHATILPPDRSGEKRLIPWPYYDEEKNPARCEGEES